MFCLPINTNMYLAYNLFHSVKDITGKDTCYALTLPNVSISNRLSWQCINFSEKLASLWVAATLS